MLENRGRDIVVLVDGKAGRDTVTHALFDLVVLMTLSLLPPSLIRAFPQNGSGRSGSKGQAAVAGATCVKLIR